MVRNALAKNIFREIKSSLGRYFAILLIIALGVGFFAGLRITEPMMKKTAVEYIDQYCLYDFRLLSTLGFTEEDVEAFSSEPGITANGAYTVDFLASVSGGGDIVLRAHNIMSDINKQDIVAGRMPENADECLLDARYYSSDILGDVVTVSSSNDIDTLDTLSYDEYTVVGLAYDPYYLNYERGTTSIGTGTVTAFAYIPSEGFSSEAYHELYLLTDVSSDAYTEEYDVGIDNYRESVDALLQERGKIRYDKIKSDAEAEISDAEKELADKTAEYENEKASAEAELASALETLRNGEEEIKSAEEELSLRKQELSDGEKSLEEGFVKLAESRDLLEKNKSDAYSLLDEQETELLRNKEEIEQGIAYYTMMGDYDTVASLENSLSAVNDGLDELSSQRALTEASFSSLENELEANEKLLLNSQEEIEAGRREIENAENTIEEKKREIESGYEEYNSSKAEADAEFADAEAQIADAEAEIQEAKTKLSELAEPDLYLLDRDSNVGYVCFENDSTIVESVSVVFPMFFLAIAILVCMTTMTRMVDECRGQIGTFKALGYGNFSIQSKFLIYSGSAAVIGWAVGYFAGTLTIPKLIWSVYGIMYGFADIIYVFDPTMFILCFAAAILCSCGAAYAACYSVLRPAPATLIRPKSPKAGKKVWLEHLPFIWKHLGFLKKVSVRNIFRYKNRLFMMILGIGGCTALLITGFGIRDSIQDVVRFQFEEVMKFDISVTVSDSASGDIIRNIESVDGVEGVLPVYTSTSDLLFGDTQKSVNLLVSENNDFGDFVAFNLDGDEVPLPGKNEAIISVGAADASGAGVGDEIMLRDSDYNEIKLTVTGIFDNYIYNYVVISPETYEEDFGTELKANTYYVNIPDDSKVRQASVSLIGIDGVSNVTVNEDTVNRMDSTMNSINYIVVMVLVCAGALAFIVIYNLTNINIEERIREIATIKVLGFRKGEVASYVMREIIILTAIGSVVGIPFGYLLHGFVMSCIQVDMVSFQNKITPLSYILSLLLTFVFAFIINIFMIRRLDKIDMASSLKSIE